MSFFPVIRARALSAAAIGACLLASAGTAVAGPIVNFTTGLSLSLPQSGTGSLTMQLTNAGDASQDVNAYTLGIMVVQTSGSGTLTFDSWTKPSNPVVGDPDAEYTPFGQPQVFQLNAPISISGTNYFDYFSVQVAATDNFNYPLAAGVTKDAGLMSFSSSGQGAWDVYVVNQAAQSGGLPVSVLQINTGTAFGFGNLAATNGASLKIGTITAVPEPSTVVLAGVAVVAGLLPVVRRRICGRLRHRAAA